MFVARKTELQLLQEQLQQKDRTALLIYGKRRIGKSALIAQAVQYFDGTVISHLCIQSTLEGNMEMLSQSICSALELPIIRFSNLRDLFEFLKKQKKSILLVLDEYQYLKDAGRKNEVDSLMQGIIDSLPGNLKLILCSSYIAVMRELLDHDNPLFGRFTAVIHLKEMDYYDASDFYEGLDIRRKTENYAVFGGSPYSCSLISSDKTLKENILRLILPSSGILRIYIENVLLKEIQKAYDVRIFSAIGNGRKRYSEIADILGGKDNGLLDKQLKTLLDMDAIEKTFPINRPNDKKKQFYVIQDNLMRFYFTYIFGNHALITRLGENAFYDSYISPSINEFISRRFEGIVNQYFQRLVHSGLRKDILDFGTYWYDDPIARKNGEFDLVIKTAEGYDFYECKYESSPMKESECRKEEAQLQELKGIQFNRIGFACISGFAFHSDRYDLISGKQLFARKLDI